MFHSHAVSPLAKYYLLNSGPSTTIASQLSSLSHRTLETGQLVHLSPVEPDLPIGQGFRDLLIIQILILFQRLIISSPHSIRSYQVFETQLFLPFSSLLIRKIHNFS